MLLCVVPPRYITRQLIGAKNLLILKKGKLVNRNLKLNRTIKSIFSLSKIGYRLGVCHG